MALCRGGILCTFEITQVYGIEEVLTREDSGSSFWDKMKRDDVTMETRFKMNLAVACVFCVSSARVYHLQSYNQQAQTIHPHQDPHLPVRGSTAHLW